MTVRVGSPSGHLSGTVIFQWKSLLTPSVFAEANTSVCGIPVFAHIRVGDELDGEVDGVLHFID